MKPREKPQKRIYLKWPWDLAVYLVLLAVLRFWSIPFILCLARWNKKHQPDSPPEGYCLHRVRGQLIRRLLWAAVFLLAGMTGAAYLTVNGAMGQTDGKYTESMALAVSGLVAVCGAGAAGYLVYTSLRDAFRPERSRLARSIHAQLPYPHEMPCTKQLFSMVDQDLERNGQWFGEVGIGKEWVLGDAAFFIPHIRSVFGRKKITPRRSGRGTGTAHIIQLCIVDDRRGRQWINMKTPHELTEVMDCLRERVPTAVLGFYGSWEYQEFINAWKGK